MNLQAELLEYGKTRIDQLLGNQPTAETISRDIASYLRRIETTADLLEAVSLFAAVEEAGRVLRGDRSTEPVQQPIEGVKE
ncbi:MAG: hypothetical protein L6R30_25875 [Thermoanaerobaculia bacterium]|nr:hypothetical protein [Thermoanaerobaculia bacterium]